MTLTIDTSAIIAVIADEPERPWIIEHTRDQELIAPASLHWEIGNAFSAMFKRKRISLDQAQHALRVYQRIPIRLLEISIDDAVHLSHELGLYAYDAYVLQTARHYNAPLLTLDGVLRRRAQQMGIPTVAGNIE